MPQIQPSPFSVVVQSLSQSIIHQGGHSSISNKVEQPTNVHWPKQRHCLRIAIVGNRFGPRRCISRSPMTRACSLMVGSRVVGSNVAVAMRNYRGCACNVGHGNGNAQPSWMVGSKEVVVIHTHRGCTVMFIANHGRGNRIGNVGHRCYTCNAGHVDNDRHLLNQRW